MLLENTFTIAAPINKAWEALNTPQTVAPCFPGATLESYEGDSFTGTVRVKLGPISLTYKGKGTYVSRDDEAHEVLIEATGRDSRGNGTASASVTGTMVADGPDKTTVTMVTDMKITGRPAQFGRGVMADVADKIIGQFAACVADKLAPPVGDSATSPAGEGSAGAGSARTETARSTPDHRSNGSRSAAPTATITAAGTARSSTPAVSGVAASKPAVSAPMRSEIDAIDLFDAAGTPVLKRLAPVLGGVLLALLFIALRRRRRT